MRSKSDYQVKPLPILKELFGLSVVSESTFIFFSIILGWDQYAGTKSIISRGESSKQNNPQQIYSMFSQKNFLIWFILIFV
jgi:hypothetical protein